MAKREALHVRVEFLDFSLATFFLAMKKKVAGKIDHILKTGAF